MSRASTFDLAVIGAGPAGAAAALAAARGGLSVALFEPRQRIDKPCGEGILPAGVVALRALGLEELLERGHPLERIRYVLASGRQLEIPLPLAGRALERPVLVGALEHSLAGEPRIVRFGERVRTERTSPGFRIFAGGGRGGEWTARSLIAADGLGGDAAGWLRGARVHVGRYGLRARAQARAPLEHVEVHLGRSSEVYLTPLSTGRINVVVLRDELPREARSARESLALALLEHPRAGRVLGAWLTPPEARALFRPAPRSVAEAGAFLAGDAAGGVDPVLGCGVSIALTTGLAAGRAALDFVRSAPGAHHRRYARFVRRETRLRRRLAESLRWMGHHPRFQEGLARLLEVWPQAGAFLARHVGGAEPVDRIPPDRRMLPTR